MAVGDAPIDEHGAFHSAITVIRWILIVAAAGLLLPVLATLLLRQFSVATPWAVAYVAASPFALFAGLGSMVLFLIARSWAGVSAAAALTAVLALTQAPLYLGSAAPGGPTTQLTVLTVNTYKGNVDAESLVAAVRHHDVDVLAVQELTDDAIRRLRSAGLEDLLPSNVLRPGRGSTGNGVWARYPLELIETPGDFAHPPVAATMDVDGLQLFIATVHPISPFPDDTANWGADLDRLVTWLGTVDGPAIIAGDFNATFDHRPFRDVLATGYRDAAEQAGSGFLPTYPANRRRLPLLITIDHVIVSDGIVAADVARVHVDGTDHEGLVATLAVPNDSAVPDP